jgi:hypothetical protein
MIVADLFTKSDTLYLLGSEKHPVFILVDYSLSEIEVVFSYKSSSD